jgi:hypothetical protein
MVARPVAEDLKVKKSGEKTTIREVVISRINGVKTEILQWIVDGKTHLL